MLADMDAFERRIKHDLEFMKYGVLHQKRGIRFDVSHFNLSNEEKEKLRGEGIEITGDDIILYVSLDEMGFPSLKLSCCECGLAADFERSVFKHYQNEIISAAQKLHYEIEAKQFKISERIAATEGFMLSIMERPDKQLSYVVQANDPDFGMCIVPSCKKAVVLKAIDRLRDAYADKIRFQFDNSDFVVLESRNYQLVRRELLVSNMRENSKRRAISVRTVLNENVYVKLSISDLTFVTNFKNRRLRVLEKDSGAHLCAVNADICKYGFRIHHMNSGLYNVYRLGTFIKPIITNANSVSNAYIHMQNLVGGNIAA